jgi:hypothetical protein
MKALVDPFPLVPAIWMRFILSNSAGCYGISDSFTELSREGCAPYIQSSDTTQPSQE